MASTSPSPCRRSSPPRPMSVSPGPPPTTHSMPNLTLDEIIASNRRTASAARRSHYANTYNTPRRGKSPHRHRTPASPRSPSRPHGSPGYNGNRRRQHHPYSRTQTPAQNQETPAAHAGEGKRLHASNLAPDVTDEALKRFLSKAGKLIECSVHFDANGESKGSALIEFANERGAMNALANLQGALLYGMPIALDILVQ